MKGGGDFGDDDKDDDKPDGAERALSGCRPERAYSNAKLATLAFSHELERRLRDSGDGEGVVSHAINPNVVATGFVEKGTPPSAQGTSMRGEMMSYFPPVWIAKKVFGFFHAKMTALLTRSAEHAARGVFHVATSDALARSGGGLFDD